MGWMCRRGEYEMPRGHLALLNNPSSLLLSTRYGTNLEELTKDEKL